MRENLMHLLIVGSSWVASPDDGFNMINVTDPEPPPYSLHQR
jgi:hypothetical protein